MQRSVAFYRDRLGLDVLEHGGDWSEITAGDQRIGLNASESPAGDGGAVIAFAVEDIETTVDELKGKGVSFCPWTRSRSGMTGMAGPPSPTTPRSSSRACASSPTLCSDWLSSASETGRATDSEES
jgi:catechol 2,3-dioxygenase-like lactoylglutathione lyase family enzyme